MNTEVLVRNTTKDAFALALKLIAMDNETYTKDNHESRFRCNGYEVRDSVLYLSKYSDKCVKFPYEFNLQQTVEFAFGWWENNKIPTEQEPDGDGSSEVAFEIHSHEFGSGSGDWGMFIAIKPIWFYYGK